MTRKRKKREPKPTLGDKLVDVLTERVDEFLGTLVTPPMFPDMTLPRGLKVFNTYDQL